MSDELDVKIMTKKRFVEAVEQLVRRDGMTYIEACSYIVEQRGMEYSAMKRLMDDSIKAKVEAEAVKLRLIKGPKPNTLPGL